MLIQLTFIEPHVRVLRYIGDKVDMISALTNFKTRRGHQGRKGRKEREKERVRKRKKIRRERGTEKTEREGEIEYKKMIVAQCQGNGVSQAPSLVEKQYSHNLENGSACTE